MQRTLFKAFNNHLQTQKLFPLFLSSTLTTISLNHSHTNITNKEPTFFRVYETFKPNEQTLVQMIRNCTTKDHIFLGKQLHCYVLRSGFTSNVFVITSLVTFYAKLVSLNNAHELFDEMPQPNVVTWNTMISGYVHSGKLYKALHFFLEMDKSDVRADAYSFTIALASCAQLSWLKLGMTMHTRIVTYGLGSNVVVGNCLIDMYGKCSSLGDAIRVFDELVEKDVISWNSIIGASARNQKIELAYDYFSRMPCPDTVTYNELINGIAQFGNIVEAIEILRNMPEPNSSSWNAIISGYVVRDRPWEAIEFFSQMHANGVATDEYTLSSILSGISRVSALKWGNLIHSFIIKHGVVASTIIGSALIGMYSKCGQIREAEMLFHSLPCKNIVTWSTMISGFAHNGESNKVIQYFEELRRVKGLTPDDITFVNLLAACSHNRMPLQKAYEYFTSMIDEYRIEPRPEHLASMIRLMGHHGEVSRAEKMIHELGFGSSSRVWRALLAACGTCGNLEVAKLATAKVTELEGNDEFGYVALSNIIKSQGNWVDAAIVWKMMRGKGVVKQAGFSWIEGGHVIK